MAIAAVALTGEACHTAVLQKVEPPGRPVDIAALWTRPDDIGSRDVFGGPAGSKSAPQSSTFEYIRGETLTSWGYDVKEPDGRRWSVKLGEEVRAEVAASRLLWAIGYHQPANYLLDQWSLTGKHAGPQSPGRFRLEQPDQKVVDIWSWTENPFVGTREFEGLIAVNVLLNNWDYKANNNKVYELKHGTDGPTRIYVVRDLGASLGLTRKPTNLVWFLGKGHPQGTKGDIDDFEQQDFVKGVERDHVVFDHEPNHRVLLDSVSVEDVRWVCGLLNQLSRAQMLDAFRAARYEDATSERYVNKIRSKVAQGLALNATPVSKSNRREQ